jgi:hypothetical protein
MMCQAYELQHVVSAMYCGPSRLLVDVLIAAAKSTMPLCTDREQ